MAGAQAVTYEDLLDFLRSPEQVVLYALTNRILKSEAECPKCKSPMVLQNFSQAPEGRALRCTACRHRLSIRTGTILEECNIGLSELFKFAYKWANDEKMKDIQRELRVTTTTTSRLAHKLVAACIHWSKKGDHRLGGPDRIVEIDETQLSRRKHEKGRLVPGSAVWIFGGIDRESKEVFLEWVKSRSEETLVPVIQEHIRPGTKIHSDSWRAYNHLDNIGRASPYSHGVVNHSKNYVDPESGVHTQEIERLWREFKQPKKMRCGIPRSGIEGYCAEFTWKRWAKRQKIDLFQAVIQLIATPDWDEALKAYPMSY